MYLEYRLTDREIGDRLGVSDVAVSKWRRKYDIQTLGSVERKITDGILSLTTLTSEILAGYVHNGIKIHEIAAMYGCSVGPIKSRLKEFNLRYPVTTDILIDLPSSLHRVVTGILLGDACIGYGDGGFTARLGVSHCHQQYGYIRKLHSLFGDWALPYRFCKGSPKSGGKVFLSYSFHTRHHPIFRQYRNTWYRDDQRGQRPTQDLKAPPLDVFRNLHDESLAYWYFDDGTYGGGLPSIVTHFPLVDPDAMCSSLRQGTGLGWYIRDSERGKSIINLRLRAYDSDEFYARIAPYATRDLAHKFPPDLHPSIPGDLLIPTELEPLSVERLHHYPASEWRCLDQGVQDQWIREVFAIYRVIGFPFPQILSPEETKTSIQTLCEHGETLSPGYSFRRSQSGLSLCNGYMPHRYEVETSDGVSALGVYHDDTAFESVIRKQFLSKSVEKVTPTEMRRALSIYGGSRTPSNFRPSAMKTIVDHFCNIGDVVWDPCAGFGGRLLGAVCSPHQVTYKGTEPSPQTVTGLRNLWSASHKVLGGEENRVQIRMGTAETEEQDPSSVQLVFTSPPYFHTERYVGGDQSYIRYPTYNVWLDGFLVAMMSKAFKFLKPGGFFGINIQNVRLDGKDYPLVKDTDSLALEIGFKRHFRAWYSLNAMGSRRPDESVLFYRKPLEVDHA